MNNFNQVSGRVAGQERLQSRHASRDAAAGLLPMATACLPPLPLLIRSSSSSSTTSQRPTSSASRNSNSRRSRVRSPRRMLGCEPRSALSLSQGLLPPRATMLARSSAASGVMPSSVPTHCRPCPCAQARRRRLSPTSRSSRSSWSTGGGGLLETLQARLAARPTRRQYCCRDPQHWLRHCALTAE